MSASPFFAVIFDPSDGQEIAKHVHEGLEQAGLNTWFDRRQPVPVLDPALLTENAIRYVDGVIFCVTPDSVRTDSIFQHFILQAQNLAKPVIVLRAVDVELPLLLRECLLVDVFADWASGLRQAAQHLQDIGNLTIMPAAEAEDNEDTGKDEYVSLNSYLKRLKANLELQLSATVFDQQRWGQNAFSALNSVIDYPFSLANASPDFWSAFVQRKTSVLLIGERGTGKTTLAQAFAYRLAWQKQLDPEAPLPFYVPLHTWNGDPNIVDWLASRNQLDAEQVAFAIHDGKVVLIFDGLNTVRQDLRSDLTNTPLDLRSTLIRVIQDLPHADVQLLITGHPSDLAFLEKAVGSQALPETLEIRPLSLEQAQRIAGNKWPVDAFNIQNVLRKPLYLTLFRRLNDVNASIDSHQELPDIEFDIIDLTIGERYEHLEQNASNKPNLLLDEIDENVTQVLWGLLTGSTRRDYIEIWNDHFEDSLGRKTNQTKADLNALGLLIPLSNNVSRLLHQDIWNYFVYGECQYRLFEGQAADQVKAALALGRLRNPRASELLLAAADVGSHVVKIQAVVALGYLGDSRTVPSLKRLLQSDSHELRAAVVEALGRIQDERALNELVNLQHDPDAQVRAAVAWALGRLQGSATVGPLIALTDDEDIDVVLRAIQSLGGVGDARAVEPLTSLLDDPEWEIRLLAIQALAEVGDDACLSDLMTCMHDSDARVRAAVFKALQTLGDESAVLLLVEALNDEDLQVRQSATKSLVALGSVAVDPLLDVLKSGDEERIFAATQTLGQIGHIALDRLLDALHASDMNVRCGAIEALGWLGDPAAVENLLPMLEVSDELVRANAAWALGNIGDVGAMAGLVTALHDQRIEVVRNAVLALENIGDERAIDPLQTLLTDTSDEELRLDVENALRSLGASPSSGLGFGLFGGR